MTKTDLIIQRHKAWTRGEPQNGTWDAEKDRAHLLRANAVLAEMCQRSGRCPPGMNSSDCFDGKYEYKPGGKGCGSGQCYVNAADDQVEEPTNDES